MQPEPPPPAFMLELELPPDDVARLSRVPELARLKRGRARAMPLRLVWHDTPAADLAADGLVLCERTAGRETSWQLGRVSGVHGALCAPGVTPLPVAEAAHPAELGRALPAPLLPVAAWEGTRRSLAGGGTEALHLELRDGALRAVAGEQACCRLLLSGPPGLVAEAAQALARELRARAPAHDVAAQAFRLAGRPLPTATLGAPGLPDEGGVSAAFAHIVGHLAAVLAHWSALAGAGPEPVHQMRVAVRRLRSAIALFRRAVCGPALDAVDADLRALMRVLGPARDWDVFAGGTGHAVASAFADEPAVTRLVGAAERRRQHSYAALAQHLESAAFRAAGIRLACLAGARPWPDIAAPPDDEAAREAADRQAAALASPLPAFAAHALTRRLDRLEEAGEHLSALPDAELHRVRIQAKRLRYAAEFFAPLYPPRAVRRYVRRVAAVQERLGHVNDGAVASLLMAQLGGAANRGHAAGVVRGYVAAGMQGARAKAERSWRKLRRAAPFWT